MTHTVIPSTTNNSVLDLALDTIAKEKQALVFVNSKRSAEKTAEDLSRQVKNVVLNELSEKILHALTKPTKQCERLAKCIKNGIAFHHAGLVHKQKELIEDEFRSGKVKVICCTPTLCLSKDTKIWHEMSETNVSKFRNSNPLFVLSKTELVSMKSQKVQKIENSSKLIQISSVSGYSIKVTPNHRILIKRNKKKLILEANKIKKSDKIATIGKLNISKMFIPAISDFVIDNEVPIFNYKFGPKLSYFIGAMLGDGYSGAETITDKIKYKGSPMIVGIDKEIFEHTIRLCRKFKLNCRETKSQHGTPQLVLSKTKWFREFLVRCGVEKGENKHISEKLITMSLENTSWLLKGLFDTDGCVEKSRKISFSNISEKLIKQMQKLLLRYEIVTSIRVKPASTMKIYGKEYKTKKQFELLITNKKCILDFYRYIGFNLKRKQDDLINLIAKITANVNCFECKKCKYKLYNNLFSGRSKEHKKWALTKLKVIKLLAEKGELGSRELSKMLECLPRKKENRLNHHYELIKKRRVGSRSTTEWCWSLNEIGKWVYENIISKNKQIFEFLKIRKCPICDSELEIYIKKGWRDSDFEGDIYWDFIRNVKEVDIEDEVYDIILPNKPKNDHMFVADGFIVHNSAGVDLPAFRTIIKDLRRYSSRGLNWIPVLEYEQQAGRAGRPSYDDYGEAICIAVTDTAKKEIVRRYVKGSVEEIYSKLAVEPVLRTYVLSLISSGFITSRSDLIDFFSKTFYAYQFKDMDKIKRIMDKMIHLLTKFEFIMRVDVEDEEFNNENEKNENNEFVSANELNEKDNDNQHYKATIIGKRVAQLYIDPLTAHYLIKHVKKDKSKNEISFLQLISHTLELRPLLKVRNKDIDEVNGFLLKYNYYILENEPEIYDPEYDGFLCSVKTAMFFYDWINEKDEEFLLEKYNTRPGEIKVKLDIADWLLYSTEELCKLLKIHPVVKDIVNLRIRLKFGVRAELLGLLRLKNIGRVRARKLHYNKVKTIEDVKKCDLSKLVQILGKKTAIDVKEQVGIKVDLSEITVKENKRIGQSSLLDYS